MGVSVFVIDELGAELPPDTIGRVVFHSPSMFDGYEGQEADFLTVTRRSGESLQGVFPTGDLGFVTQGASALEIVILGREKETIVIGARRYFSLDVEAAVARACPGLSVDSVIAISDPGDAKAVRVLIEGPLRVDLSIHRIEEALEWAFPGLNVRIAVLAGRFLWTSTSAKKPRLQSRAAFAAGTLPILTRSEGRHEGDQP